MHASALSTLPPPNPTGRVRGGWVLRGVLLLLLFSPLALAHTAGAFTMGFLPPNPLCASSGVQLNGFGPVPQDGPGAVGQIVCVTPPDVANSLFGFAFPDNSEAGTANMSMGVGSFRALVTAAGTHLPVVLGPSAEVIGTIEDQLIVSGGIGKGTIVLPLHLTGSVGMVFTVPAGQPFWHFLEAGFSFSCVTHSITGLGPSGPCGGNVKLDPGGEAQFVFDHAQTIDMTFLMTIPFTFDDEFLLQRSVMLAAGLVPPFFLGSADYSGTVSGNFLDTGVLEKARVLDAFGDEVPGATILSLSGFDYLNPAVVTEPPGEPGPGPGGSVPAPGALAMVALGGIVLAIRRQWGKLESE